MVGFSLVALGLILHVYNIAFATEEFVLSEESVQRLKDKGEVTLPVVYLPPTAPFHPHAVYREVNGVMTLHPNVGGRSVARISSEGGEILWESGMAYPAKGTVSVQGPGMEIQNGGVVRRWLTFRMDR